MDVLTLLTEAEGRLREVVSGIDDAELDVVSNCAPWTVRRLAGHALKNQLFWAGVVTGQDLMAQDEAMAAVPYDADLGPVAAEVTATVVELWHTAGVLEARHVTPFGELPGAVVVDFALVDAAAHAWDLSASVGRPMECPPGWVDDLTGVVERTCTDHAVEIGLVKPPTEAPPDATASERLMARAGRIVRPGVG
jgi:uncharacterized protein (TIGR03086 family)